MKSRKEAADEREAQWIRDVNAMVLILINPPFGGRLIPGKYVRQGKTDWIEFIGGPVGKHVAIKLYASEENGRLLSSIAATLRNSGYRKIEVYVTPPKSENQPGLTLA